MSAECKLVHSDTNSVGVCPHHSARGSRRHICMEKTAQTKQLLLINVRIIMPKKNMKKFLSSWLWKEEKEAEAKNERALNGWNHGWWQTLRGFAFSPPQQPMRAISSCISTGSARKNADEETCWWVRDKRDEGYTHTDVPDTWSLAWCVPALRGKPRHCVSIFAQTEVQWCLCVC